MHIENLSLINFKNYDELSLKFSKNINCLVGPNGSGKTNILDAIHYLSLTKSAFNSLDSQNIKTAEKFFTVKGSFFRGDNKFEILCSLQQGVKKVLKIDKKEYLKLSEHVGKFPIVLIEPNDTDLIRGASELRRKFFDAIISQMDAAYLNNLISYGANLKQRNALLKKFARSNSVDDDLLEPYNVRLINLGKSINASRLEFIELFSEIFSKKYAEVAELNEKVHLNYSSEFNDLDFETKFRKSLQKELMLERTSMGVHKDDYHFTIHSKPVKKFGSQGQQKSYVVALKLAHFHLVNDKKGFEPILLLDDIFDKLDARRVGNLINMIIKDNFGQIFITDAQEERMSKVLQNIDIEKFIFSVDNGNVKRLS